MNILNIREAHRLLDKVESLQRDLLIIKERDYIQAIDIRNMNENSSRVVKVNQEISSIIKSSIIKSIEREIDSLKKEISKL